ncbi:MAG: hypothetical protein JWO80_847 [Bryobacterales bacterium]|nr:hypothetical protein [Bryobacterales bacterium]
MRHLLFCAFVAAGFASAAEPIVNPDDIIRKFSAKESEFQKARENYTYRQTVKLTEVDANGNPEGKWELVSDIVFGPDGKRTEKVVYAPVISLKHILLTPQDEQDLRNVQPFVLNSKDITKYDVRYLGKSKVDEVPCYQFSVKPKTMVKGQRYFEGEIWVDDRDLQIVKSYGKGVGIQSKNDAFPKFETYREQIDGKYWFPTYTHADDVLRFPEYSQHITMTVKYQDYKQFKSDVNITFGDEVKDGSKPTTPPTAPPTPPHEKP